MRAAGIALIAGALALAACERGPQPAKKEAEAKPRTLAEIDSAVARLEAQNRQLEASLRKLEQGSPRWVMWQSAQPVHGGAAFLPPPLPLAAFADKEPCVEAIHEAVSGAQRVISRTGPASYQAVGSDGVLMQVTYTCLPETIDPRRAAAAR